MMSMNFLSSAKHSELTYRRRRAQDEDEKRPQRRADRDRQGTRRSASSTSPERRTAAATESSADDEALDEGEDDVDEDEDLGRPSGWRRAERLASSRMPTSSIEAELQRERSIAEEDIKSSLSTILMLRPGNDPARIPAFLTDLAASSSLSSSLHGPSESAPNAVGGTMAGPAAQAGSSSSLQQTSSLSTSPSSTVTVIGGRRRSTSRQRYSDTLAASGSPSSLAARQQQPQHRDVQTPSSYRRSAFSSSGSPQPPITSALRRSQRQATDSYFASLNRNPISRGSPSTTQSDQEIASNWAEVNVSSASSFEDLAAHNDAESPIPGHGDDDGELILSDAGDERIEQQDESIHQRLTARRQRQRQDRTPQARNVSLPSVLAPPPSQRPPANTAAARQSTLRGAQASAISEDLRQQAPHSIQSEPELDTPSSARMRRLGQGSRRRRSRPEPQVDENFMELIDAARTFISMRAPSYIVAGSAASSAVGPAASGLRSFARTAPPASVDTTFPGRHTLASLEPLTSAAAAAPSHAIRASQDEQMPEEPTSPLTPPPPVSMSNSTTFALSSSDSPPSRGFASSREDDEHDSEIRSPSPLIERQPGARRSDADQSADRQEAAEPRGGRSRLERDERLVERAESNGGGTAGSTEAATPREGDRPHDAEKAYLAEQDSSKELETSDPSHARPESVPPSPSPSRWWDWLARQIRRITIGFGLIGVGLVVAVGVGVLKKPSIRRK